MINNPAFQQLSRLFLLITVIGGLHMVEQLLFGIEEYYMLAGLVDSYHGLFPTDAVGYANVILITVTFGSVSLLVYLLLLGGRAALSAVAVFGVLGVTEAHHWIEAVEKVAYDPGLVTSIAYVWVGFLILAEVRRQWRNEPALQQVPA